MKSASVCPVCSQKLQLATINLEDELADVQEQLRILRGRVDELVVLKAGVPGLAAAIAELTEMILIREDRAAADRHHTEIMATFEKARIRGLSH
jgi:uncharacterized Zn finger protein (UPF0148 family)